MRRLGALLGLLGLLIGQPAYAASLSPPSLVQATTAASADLFLVWPTASTGPLEAMSYANLKALLNTDLSFLRSASNLSDLGSPTIARTNLGLGTAALMNTGTGGATVCVANAVCTLSGTQTFTVAPVFTDASGSRTALGLGTAATVATGTSGGTLCLLNAACTWGTTQTFTVAPVFTAAAGTRTALGLAIGTNVQAWDADLDALAALSGTNTIYYRSASNTWTPVTIGANLTFSGGTLAASGGSSGGTSGSWTPVLSFATPGNLSVSYNAGRFGTYVCVNVTGGSLVQVEAHITTSTFTFTTASGALLIGPLPYAALNATLGPGGSVTNTNGNVTWTGQLVVQIADSTHFGINKLTSGSSATAMSTSSFATGSPPNIDIVATYQSASAC